MARGPKKHLKRVNAPKRWMLDKLSGVYAPRPSTGPHKLRECLPLAVLLRNKLKYALNGTEIISIVKDKEGLIQVDGKVRRDPRFPTGFMDVVSIPKTGENMRMLFDVKGRFVPVRIEDKEAGFKLCQVKRRAVGPTKAPFITTHDARTIRFAHPSIKVHDTIKINLETGEIEDTLHFESGNLAMITGGNNVGRVGIIAHRERHPGSFEIVHLRDSKGHSFATRLQNVFVIGHGKKPIITLPKGAGIKLSVLEERAITVEQTRKASA